MGMLLTALVLGVLIGLGIKLFGWFLRGVLQIIVACVKLAFIVACVFSFVYFIILILPIS